MTVDYEQLEAILVQLTPDENQSVLHFAEFLLQQKQVPVNKRMARRKVSAWLVRDVGNLLLGGDPEYLAGERSLWRVPVLVTHPRRGCAAFVDVDAYTGDLLVTEDTPEEIRRNVQTFLASTTSN
ncbi:MAG: hypothetical protein JW981_06405 [Anaerolineae bacterium]|nr:hypothetical protein [Anaerolineae bacterium]